MFLSIFLYIAFGDPVIKRGVRIVIPVYPHHHMQGFQHFQK